MFIITICRSDIWSVLDPSVEKPSVDKIAKSQKSPTGNTLSQRQGVVDNSLLVEHATAKTKSNSIKTNSRELDSRQNNIKYNTTPYVPKNEVSTTKITLDTI